MKEQKKVVLLGYMASGKSSVGRKLAGQIASIFLDLDDVIEEDVGLPIPEIFEKKGELFFRKKETEILRQILDENTNMVLALGGGTPCYGQNMQWVLESTPYSFYLQLSIPNLVERIEQEKQNRPLVAHVSGEDLPEFVGKHLFERALFYSKAHYTLDCNGKDISTIVNEIQDYLK